MENGCTHKGQIQYILHISMEDSILELTLEVADRMCRKIFRNFLIDDSLPFKLKKQAKNIENIYNILQKKENFEIDPVKGAIFLKLKKMELEDQVFIELNKIQEKEELRQAKVMNFIVQRQRSESLMSEDFNDSISNIDFPLFDQSFEKIDFHKRMAMFKQNLEKWKAFWLKKKQQLNAKIKVKFAENASYKGEWENSKKHGFGIIYGQKGKFSGDRYEGQFNNDEKNGIGIYFWTDGDRFEGEFKNNQRNGNGIYFYRNGDWEEGEYDNNFQHGQSVYYEKTGGKEERVYIRGKRIK